MCDGLEAAHLTCVQPVEEILEETMKSYSVFHKNFVVLYLHKSYYAPILRLCIHYTHTQLRGGIFLLITKSISDC